MKKILFFMFTILWQICSFGCATATGPLFNEISIEGHQGKAIVYFYRNSDIGRAAIYDLKINEDVTLPLLNKGYHLFVLEPGAYEFEVFNNSKILKAESKFVLEGDKTYFIRYWTNVLSEKIVWLSTLTPAPHLKAKYIAGISLVPREEALEVLSKCRLIEVSEQQKGTSKK